ncbi:MAG: sensor histidine kinase, partial [Desulfosalsimonas sp.]
LFENNSGAPGKILADRVKLAQILINLIQNAINFTETGAVTVRVFTETPETPIASAAGMLGFSVTDTGCGIQASEIKSIFEPFSQADTGRLSGRGTGLGLAITGNYISMMNGTMDEDSTPAKGSCFRFFIPLKQAFQPGQLAGESGSKTAGSGLFTQPDLFSGPLPGPDSDRGPEDHGPAAEGMDQDEIASRLACVPAVIVEEMEKAAFFAEIDRLTTAIEGVTDWDAELAAVLADAADAFDYNRVLGILRCSPHPTSYPDTVL